MCLGLRFDVCILGTAVKILKSLEFVSPLLLSQTMSDLKCVMCTKLDCNVPIYLDSAVFTFFTCKYAVHVAGMGVDCYTSNA
jgi:hypothetical protein